MATEREHWLRLEQEFSSLGKTPDDFYPIWSSSRPADKSGIRLLPSHWSWWGWQTEEHRLKFTALAREAAAMAAGVNNEDTWLDEFRKRGINYHENGTGMFHFPVSPWKQLDGHAWGVIRIEYRSGHIERLFESSAALARSLAAETFEVLGTAPSVQMSREERVEILKPMWSKVGITSQNHRADHSGVGRATVSDIMSGKKSASPGIRRKLAKSLKVDPHKLPF